VFFDQGRLCGGVVESETFLPEGLVVNQVLINMEYSADCKRPMCGKVVCMMHHWAFGNFLLTV